jgi:23S rRNA (adenine2030-N6)-methyltransferase
MLSYRHAFHAGNHADVLKHLTLVAAVKYLTQKDAGLTVIDTHAGAGLYRLDGDMARTSAEAQEGIFKLFSQQNGQLVGINTALNATNSIAKTTPAKTAPTKTVQSLSPSLQDYLDAIAHFNSAGKALRQYPGSPLLIHSLLREGVDKLKLFELHPTDYRALSGHVRQLSAGEMISIDCANGFDKLKTLLPPPLPHKRALVLIDPSYEIKSDYAQVAACVQEAIKRFPAVTLAVWYPIIARPEAHGLPKKLKTMATQAKRSWLHATLNIGQEALALTPGQKPPRHTGLRASGMFLINPPFTLKEALQPALPQLVQLLGRGRGKGSTLESA